MGKIEEPQMSEEELRNLLEYSECATFVLEQGMEFKVVYANPKFYQILRYTKEEFADLHQAAKETQYRMGIAKPYGEAFRLPGKGKTAAE